MCKTQLHEYMISELSCNHGGAHRFEATFGSLLWQDHKHVLAIQARLPSALPSPSEHNWTILDKCGQWVRPKRHCWTLTYNCKVSTTVKLLSNCWANLNMLSLWHPVKSSSSCCVSAGIKSSFDNFLPVPCNVFHAQPFSTASFDWNCETTAGRLQPNALISSNSSSGPIASKPAASRIHSQACLMGTKH